MTQYISKDALVAEIQRRIDENKTEIQCATHKHLEEYFEGYEDALVLFKEKFLDTLKVKDADYKPIDKDFERDAVSFCIDNGLNTTPYIAKTIAKYFFELGLNARSCNDNIEYICTDAFIEKTCEFLKSYRQDTPDGTGYIAGIVNDKTIEDFRNYTKGE